MCHRFCLSAISKKKKPQMYDESVSLAKTLKATEVSFTHISTE